MSLDIEILGGSFSRPENKVIKRYRKGDVVRGVTEKQVRILNCRVLKKDVESGKKSKKELQAILEARKVVVDPKWPVEQLREMVALGGDS